MTGGGVAALLLAFGLAVYLAYALLFPERFDG